MVHIVKSRKDPTGFKPWEVCEDCGAIDGFNCARIDWYNEAQAFLCQICAEDYMASYGDIDGYNFGEIK